MASIQRVLEVHPRVHNGLIVTSAIVAVALAILGGIFHAHAGVGLWAAGGVVLLGGVVAAVLKCAILRKEAREFESWIADDTPIPANVPNTSAGRASPKSETDATEPTAAPAPTATSAHAPAAPPASAPAPATASTSAPAAPPASAPALTGAALHIKSLQEYLEDNSCCEHPETSRKAGRSHQTASFTISNKTYFAWWDSKCHFISLQPADAEGKCLPKGRSQMNIKLDEDGKITFYNCEKATSQPFSAEEEELLNAAYRQLVLKEPPPAPAVAAGAASAPAPTTASATPPTPAAPPTDPWALTEEDKARIEALWKVRDTGEGMGATMWNIDLDKPNYPPGHQHHHSILTLNQSHVHRYFCYLAAQYPQATLPYASDSLTGLTQANFQMDYLERMIFKRPINFEKKMLFPIDLGGHWIFVGIDHQTREIWYCDSKLKYGNYEGNIQTLRGIADRLTRENPGTPYQVDSKFTCCIQSDGYQCGVWAAFCAEKFLTKPDFPFKKMQNIESASVTILSYRQQMQRILHKMLIIELDNEPLEDEAFLKAYGSRAAAIQKKEEILQRLELGERWRQFMRGGLRPHEGT